MNKPVSLELKQLLYNKGWRYELSDDISETGSLYNNHSLAEERFNQNDVSYVDITIADIIMWLFNEHGIWVDVNKIDGFQNLFFYTIIGSNGFNNGIPITVMEWNDDKCDEMGYNNKYKDTPQEAYIEAIKYCLNNKINN